MTFQIVQKSNKNQLKKITPYLAWPRDLGRLGAELKDEPELRALILVSSYSLGL